MGTWTCRARHGRLPSDLAEASHFVEHGWTRAPLLVQWMATTRCPLACPHCLAHDDGPSGEELSTAEALALVDASADLGVTEFLLTGGEPLVREDLPEVLERLAQRGLSWSLNTAVMPSVPLRQAMERRPPQFVAVSLDGPQRVHDAFRGRPGAFAGALESIRFFRQLGVPVAAGTTVTRANFGALRETFATVVESGASSWGIHILFPEGRAAARPDLFLSRRQLGRLLRFVAAARRRFPVSFADEFGWSGDWEPVLRDAPMTCGAGRLQCVVLPDGEVVPCTTMDRAASAGNVRQRPLGEIWSNGFAALRARRPRGKCRTCEHFAACAGGCWLQRRRGQECFRDVWERPKPHVVAAGLIGMLGLGAVAARGQEEPPYVLPGMGDDTADAPTTEVQSGLEHAIVAWYSESIPETRRGLSSGMGALTEPEGVLGDPGWEFFRRYRDGSLPAGLEDRLAAVRGALGTSEMSLALGGLLLRSLAEAVLDGPGPAERDGEAGVLLRETLQLLRSTIEGWRQTINANRTDPYLARERRPIRYRFEMSKALIPAPAWLDLARETAAERWGVAGEGEATAQEHIDRHPWGEDLAIRVVTWPAAMWKVDGATCVEGADGTTIGPFDMVILTALKGSGDPTRTVTMAWGEEGEPLEVELPQGVLLWWADIVRLAHEQHHERLDEAGADVVEEARPASWGEETGNPFLLPLARARGRHGAAWLADFWLF